MAGVLQASIAASSGLDPVNRVSYLESTFYMRNTLLRDSDFMSMAHGLELRVPFLDRALVEACFRIPGDEKLQGDTPKRLLLKNLGVELPSEIVNRPKRGFTLPFEHWLRAEMKPMVEESLSGSCGAEGLLNTGAMRAVWSRFLAGNTSWSRPWSFRCSALVPGKSLNPSSDKYGRTKYSSGTQLATIRLSTISYH